MVATGAIEGEQVSLTFKPQACVLALNIYGGNTTETVTDVRFLSKTKPSGSATLDLTAETLSYAGSAYEASVSLTEGFNPEGTKPSDTKLYENQVYLIVAKESYADITFVVTTWDTEGNLHNYTRTSTAELDCSNVDTITVNLNLSSEQVSTLKDGDYVLLVQDTATYYAVSAENNGSTDRRERVEIVDYNGEAEYETTDENVIWTIQNTVGGYTVKNGENYMTGGSSTAPLKTDAEVLVITKDGIIKSANYFEIQLAMNGSYGHGFYKNSNYPSNYSLIPVQENSRERLATPTEGETETGSDSATVKWAAVENAASYTVTLTGSNTEVTKTETETEATFENLEIDEYEVTVVANPSEGSTTYRESLPLTLSFQIYAADASFYTMITTMEEFEAALDENGSGQFVITSTLANEKYYALDPGKALSSNKSEGTEITVSENKILSTTAEKYLWTITSTSEGYYTLYNGESYLYHSSSSSTNIALGNTSLSYWVIELYTSNDDPYDFTFKSSYTDSNRYLLLTTSTEPCKFGAYAESNRDKTNYFTLYLFAKAKDNE